jgi:hypothetical protein
MKMYYWIAINGASDIMSPVPMPATLAVKPVPQRLLGFDSAEEAAEIQQFLLAASIPEREKRHDGASRTSSARGNRQYRAE